jgi:hypothetical protein
MTRRKRKTLGTRMVIEQRHLQRTGETFLARAFLRSGKVETFGPAESVGGAMKQAQDACDAGKDVVVRGEYTSDGTRWKDHGGRIVAACDRKRWHRY